MPGSPSSRRRQSWWSRRTGAQQVAIITAVIVACGAVAAAVAGGLLQGGTTINVFAGSSSPAPSAGSLRLSASADVSGTATPADHLAGTCSSAPAGTGTQPIFFCDDFRSHAYGGWQDPNTQSDGAYRPGGYQVTANSPGVNVQVGYPAGGPATLRLYSSADLLLTVQADSSSVADGQYGLACRGGPDLGSTNGKGYAFVLQEDTAIIEKVEFPDGIPRPIRLKSSEQPAVVRAGLNLLQASCVTGHQRPAVQGQPGKPTVKLTFWVNGTKVASYTDANMPFIEGYAGVVTLTGESATHDMTATFDHFGAYRT